jgi:hypothetical protein
MSLGKLLRPLRIALGGHPSKRIQRLFVLTNICVTCIIPFPARCARPHAILRPFAKSAASLRDGRSFVVDVNPGCFV